MRIAVIGAGMAGASCARALVDQGHDVFVFDKGRGVGGRLAQRRRENAMFDHGAQYFTARDPAFKALTKAWIDQGKVALWDLGHKNGESTYIGMPSMSQPAKELLQGIDVATERRVTKLTLQAGRIELGFEDGDFAGPFDSLAIAVPHPQAVELLQSIEGSNALLEGIAHVQMAPCWTTMLAFDVPISASVPSGPIQKLDSVSAIGWIARNISKQGREGRDAWTLHASPEWSRQHLEDQAGDVLNSMIQAFNEHLDTPLPAIAYKAAHRWRYAFVEKPLGQPAIGDPALGIALMGDWCLAPRVEAAFVSGRAGAAMLANSDI